MRFIRRECERMKIKGKHQQALTPAEEKMLIEAGVKKKSTYSYKFRAVNDYALEIYQLWRMSIDQAVYVGMGYPTAIDVQSVIALIRFYNVPRSLRLFYFETLFTMAETYFRAVSETADIGKE